MANLPLGARKVINVYLPFLLSRTCYYYLGVCYSVTRRYLGFHDNPRISYLGSGRLVVQCTLLPTISTQVLHETSKFDTTMDST